MTNINPKLIRFLSRLTWALGLASFLAISRGYLFITIKVIYQSFASIFTERTIDIILKKQALFVISEFFFVLATCLTCHLLLAVLSFTVTGSQYIVDKYLERDEELRNALQEKISIQQQFLDLHKTFEGLQKAAKIHTEGQCNLHKNLDTNSKTLSSLANEVDNLTISIIALGQASSQTLEDDGDF